MYCIIGILLLLIFIFYNSKENFINNNKYLYNSIELDKLLNKNKNILLINVLTNKYYNNCHIENSINWTVKEIMNNPFYIPSIDKIIFKNTPIIVYCGHNNCNTSTIAYEYLLNEGFKNIYRYVGGMTDWYLSHKKSIGPCDIEEYTKCQNHDCSPPYPPI